MAQTRLHCCLETHGHVCKWDGDNLTVWASTQGVYASQEGFTGALGLKPAQVRVITEHMGGGFGSKFGPNEEGIICAQAGKAGERAGEADAHPLGRADGQLQRPRLPGTRSARARRPTGRSRRSSPRPGATVASTAAAIRCTAARTSTARRTSTPRGPTSTRTPAARARCALPAIRRHRSSWKSMMDDLAEKLGMDPLEFRRKNDPNKVRNEEYTIGAERIGWSNRPKRAGEGSGTQRVGYGMRRTPPGAAAAARAPRWMSRSIATARSRCARHARSGYRHAHLHGRHPGRGVWSRSARGDAADGRHELPAGRRQRWQRDHCLRGSRRSRWRPWTRRRSCSPRSRA